MRLGPAKRTQTLVRPMANQGLETEPDRVGIRLRSRSRPGVALQALVDMKRLLHTDDYAISVWLDLTSPLSCATDNHGSHGSELRPSLLDRSV